MLAPIEKPLGKYPKTEIPLLDDLPIYDGIFHLEDPCLLLTGVDWQPDRSGMRYYLTDGEEASPEMGMGLDDGLGGRLSVLVLCYGDFPNLHKRCLNSIIRSLPMYRLDLRVALNCVGPATLEYVDSITATKVYHYEENAYKYPIMREMLNDLEAPLLGKYVAWFDDNAFVSEPNWVNLAADIIKKQNDDVGMYGIRMYQSVTRGNSEEASQWIEDRPWHQGIEFMNSDGVSGGLGEKTFHFCADWFWIANKQVLYEADIPCPDLVQRGGGPVIGEQLHQAGYKIKQFNVGKEYIYMPSFKKQVRRGDPGKFPWQQDTE